MLIVQKYFPDLTDSQIKKYTELQKIYISLNAAVNVISRKDIHLLYERHVLHSLSIAKLIAFKDNTRVLDVGTGGGFPGIPLALYFPNVKFHLVDSIGKKIKVVEQVRNLLKLKNVTFEKVRAEDLDGYYDFIISRAVTALPKFITLTKHLISKRERNILSNGIIYLKGGDFEEELKEIRWKNKLYEIGDWFEEDFFETKKIVHIYR